MIPIINRRRNSNILILSYNMRSSGGLCFAEFMREKDSAIDSDRKVSMPPSQHHCTNNDLGQRLEGTRERVVLLRSDRLSRRRSCPVGAPTVGIPSDNPSVAYAETISKIIVN